MKKRQLIHNLIINFAMIFSTLVFTGVEVYAADGIAQAGFKYAFFKFLIAMLGVLVSSLAIFIGLKFYKKIVLKSDLKQSDIDYDKTLESPKNFKEAINLFLNKTNKR